MSELLNPAPIQDWDDQVPDEYFQSGSEPLPAGWAHVVIAEVETGISGSEKKTPFGNFDLVVKNGRPEYFGKDGKPRHAFVRLYTGGGYVKFVRGLYEKALGLPSDPERKLGTAYLRQAIGKEFITRFVIEVDKAGRYADKNVLGEFHPVTPEWLAFVEEDKSRAAGQAPKRGRKAKGGAGAIPPQRAAGPMIG